MMTTCPNCKVMMVVIDNHHSECPQCRYGFATSAPSKYKGDKATQEVNQAIKEMLVEARITGEDLPWKQPWIVIPKRNYDTGRKYTGVNRWLLSFDPEIAYVTKKSIEKKGLILKEEAKERFVMEWVPPYLTNEEKGKCQSPADEKALLAKKFPFKKIGRLYMAKDIEGLEPKIFEDEKKNDRVSEPEEFLEKVKAMGIAIVEGGNYARYNPATDEVVIPSITQFESSDDYYRSLFHELAHATGHKSRLNRDQKTFNRDIEYGKEELIAEVASAYMCQCFNIPCEQNTVAYIDNWLKAIEGDAQLLVSAAQRAEKVLTYFGLN